MARTIFTSRSHSFDASQGEARLSLARTLRLDLQFMEQVHGSEVVHVDSALAKVPTCDALVTKTPGVGLAVMVADCLPILIDGVDVVAAVHAGRKGLVSNVIGETIAHMQKLGSSALSEFTVQIGPSICATCYEVSHDMYAELVGKLPHLATTTDRHALNLQAEAIFQLLSLGLSPSSIRDWGICTQESELHFSFRGGDLTSRQIGVISL